MIPQERAKSDMTRHISRMIESSEKTKSIFIVINALDIATKIFEIAAKSMSRTSSKDQNPDQTLLGYCHRISQQYLSWYPVLRDTMKKHLSDIGISLGDGQALEKAASKATLDLLDYSEKLRGTGQEVSQDDILHIIVALTKNYSRENQRIQGKTLREFVEDSDEVSLFTSQIDKETQLYMSIMETERFIDSKGFSTKVRNQIEATLWGETRKSEDIYVKVEHLFFNIVVPHADQLRRRIWSTFDIDPQDLSSKSKRINFQWASGFIVRNITNIMNYEREKMLDKMKLLLSTQEGRQTLNEITQNKGFLTFWLDERLKFRFSCYPSIVLAQDDKKELHKNIQSILTLEAGENTPR